MAHNAAFGALFMTDPRVGFDTTPVPAKNDYKYHVWNMNRCFDLGKYCWKN
jgi:hypothetical protein